MVNKLNNMIAHARRRSSVLSCEDIDCVDHDQKSLESRDYVSFEMLVDYEFSPERRKDLLKYLSGETVSKLRKGKIIEEAKAIGAIGQ